MLVFRWSLRFIVCAVAPVLAAQGQNLAGCYRFDRTLIHWRNRDAWGSLSVAESTAVLRLTPTPHARAVAPPQSRVVPGSGRFDNWAEQRWARSSSWHPVAPDSLFVAWHDGFSGPVFRLRVFGDTLRGRVTFTVDADDGTPWRTAPVQAVRVPCPNRPPIR